MAEIPDISESEQWILKTSLKERYGHDVELSLGDAEIRVHPSDRQLTNCPVVHWQGDDGCNFIVFKVGDRNYRCQFFYRGYQQYGTGVPEYDDLSECVVDLLQVQADYAARERGDIPAKRR